MTNREWLNTLTDEQLANFLTVGLYVRYKSMPDIPIMFSIKSLTYQYVQSTIGLTEWLSQPCGVLEIIN